MLTNRRRIKRFHGKRDYRKIFYLATEGVITEVQYFAKFNGKEAHIHVKHLKGNNDSSPPQVLKRMTNYLKNVEFNENDEAWLVVDKDSWSDEQLNQLYKWSMEAENHYFALSNPKFEFWLLLHFEEGHSFN